MSRQLLSRCSPLGPLEGRLARGKGNRFDRRWIRLGARGRHGCGAAGFSRSGPRSTGSAQISRVFLAPCLFRRRTSAIWSGRLSVDRDGASCSWLPWRCRYNPRSVGRSLPSNLIHSCKVQRPRSMGLCPGKAVDQTGTRGKNLLVALPLCTLCSRSQRHARDELATVIWLVNAECRLDQQSAEGSTAKTDKGSEILAGFSDSPVLSVPCGGPRNLHTWCICSWLALAAGRLGRLSPR